MKTMGWTNVEESRWNVIPYGQNYSFYTYSTEQRPSWEANRFSDSQEIPRILWNPRFITVFTIAQSRSDAFSVNDS